LTQLLFIKKNSFYEKPMKNRFGFVSVFSSF
jgi:hypothetical protein